MCMYVCARVYVCVSFKDKIVFMIHLDTDIDGIKAESE